MTFPLFSVYGVEIEYMLVDKSTLDVTPAADKLLENATGQAVSEAEFDDVAWSNELALHVIEMKTNGPRVKLYGLADSFQNNVKHINQLLSESHACLLPTGAHPWMDPHRESFLWSHEQNEVYEAYNKIFDCSGHGWTNLQSTHLNLPFSNDKEFALLHCAIRLLLPIIPALSASTPIIDGEKTGYVDTRLKYYQFNQKKIPIIAGELIPEIIFSQEEYQQKILDRIYREIAPYDPNFLLQDEWLNSRGAIARFERNAIEIRIIDTQECPMADIAIVDGVTETLRYLTEKINLLDQEKWSCERLLKIFNQIIQAGQSTVITDSEYLSLFGLDQERCTAKQLWQHIILNLIQLPQVNESVLRIILDQGNLAERILCELSQNHEPSYLKRIYQKLAACLEEGRLYYPNENHY